MSSSPTPRLALWSRVGGTGLNQSEAQGRLAYDDGRPNALGPVAKRGHSRR
jgi:hypothetical protein